LAGFPRDLGFAGFLAFDPALGFAFRVVLPAAFARRLPDAFPATETGTARRRVAFADSCRDLTFFMTRSSLWLQLLRPFGVNSVSSI
jgi:hypothetical protein